MTYDVLIIGGGMIGGVLTRALGLKGFTVCVIDAASPPQASPKDFRTSAIAATSKYLLERCDIWPALENVATSIETIVVQDYEQATPLVYNAHDLETFEPLGYMVPNAKLREAIYTLGLTTPGVTWLSATPPQSLKFGQHSCQVTLASGDVLEGKLLVGADGKHSWTRTQLNIPLAQWNYDQVAVVGICEHPYPHRNTAVEYFAPEGPLALLPMGRLPTPAADAAFEADHTPQPERHYSALVWSCTAPLKDKLLNGSDADAADYINQTFMDHRGPLQKVTDRFPYALSVVLPQTFISQRCCLIGDAAHAMHPVAGQGANVGFRDVEALIGQLEEARRLGLDLGSATLLGRFYDDRQFDHHSMLFTTHSIVQLFSTLSPISRFPRQLGMQLVNHIKPLRHRLMRHAMGYPAPRLLPPFLSRSFAKLLTRFAPGGKIV